MEYNLPDELGTDWLSISNRFHVAREKQFSKERPCVGPFFLLQEDRTARPNRAQIHSSLMEMDITVDGGRHLLRTVVVSWLVACAKGYRSC